ncbi:MAG: PAS domain S-box protein, partial [Deltaproteobacteria bacterium]|nr:PAS domain S-box protein [Deltaproteobacteria bacterium]
MKSAPDKQPANRSVLLVEDNRSDVVLVRAILSRSALAPLTVQAVGSVAEALEALSAGGFDVVLLDLGLPDLGGKEALVAVQGAAGNTPIIVLSAHDDVELERELIAEGVQDYLVKGQVGGFLPRAIIHAVERSRLQRTVTQAQESLSHINHVLHAIRGIIQLTLRERDPHALVEKTCELLVEKRGYEGVWFVLFDNEGAPEFFAKRGWKKGFTPLVEGYRGGNAPPCIRTALATQGATVVDPKVVCAECPISGAYTGDFLLIASLRYGDRVFGVLNAALAGGGEISEEEASLFGELADDVAFALHDIALEKTRQEVEESLRRERDRAQRYLEIAGVMVVALDADGKVTLINSKACVTLINSKACEVLGWAQETAIGRDWFKDSLREDVRSHTRDVFGQLMRDEVSLAAYNENSVVGAGGKERLIGWHNTVLRGPGGEVRGALSSGLDITDQRAAEEAIRVSERNLRTIFEDSSDGIVLVDPATRMIQTVNRTFGTITGYSREESATL